MLPEIAAKHRRLIEYMDGHELCGLVLASRANFSWLTGGKVNFVNGAVDSGVAPLAVTRERIVCVTTNIEQSRIGDEELAGTGIAILSHPWQTPAKRGELFADVFGGAKVGYDVSTAGLPREAKPLAGDFSRVRWSLLAEEIERYRQAGRSASLAMENTVKRIKPGMSECEIAGIAAECIWAECARPWVLLIAADERIRNYRHPIPTDNRLKKIVEVVFCVEQFGLVCSLTRLVSFGAIDSDLRKRHEAVVRVDASVMSASKPGKTLGEMFEVICAQYEQAGFPGEWQKHHQGGPTGYNSRDCVATPGDGVKLVANQALAWNPSITGTKSEDTIIMSDGEPIIVTAASGDWPMITFEGPARPDILIV